MASGSVQLEGVCQQVVVFPPGGEATQLADMSRKPSWVKAHQSWVKSAESHVLTFQNVTLVLLDECLVLSYPKGGAYVGVVPYVPVEALLPVEVRRRPFS